MSENQNIKKSLEKKEVKTIDKNKLVKKQEKPLDVKPLKSKNTTEGESGIVRTLLIIGLIIGLVLLLIGLLLLFLKLGDWVYTNIPGEPQNLNPEINGLPNLNFSENDVRQFYPNIKFNHNTISYQIDSSCTSDKRLRMVGAFDMLKNKISKLNFQYTSTNNSDIEILCGNGKIYTPDESDFFIAGEGGAKELIQTGRFNIITNGTVFLYEKPKNAISCSWSNIELHELIHVFGFNHSTNPRSLMYPYLENCNQELDPYIINELTRLYTIPNLPDLYFENVTAVKKGRYLDFNITIKNSGDIDFINATFSVIDDGKLVDTKELKDIKFGAGIAMDVKNFKLLSRESKEILIVLDYINKSEELDKTNNIARIKF